MYDINQIKQYIKDKNTEAVKWLMAEHNLVVEAGKLVTADKVKGQYWKGFWNQRQQARKILLNSLYGALLNSSCKFYDKRIGQSTTLTGRSIVKHMNSKINETITGEYDYKGDGIVYADTDSVASDSIIDTNYGPMTVEQVFAACNQKWQDGEKQYGYDLDLEIPVYDPYDNMVRMQVPQYVYRHKVKKAKWKITDSEGRSIIVTEDHSIMVERGADVIEIKPCELQEGDVLVTYNHKYQ